MSSEGQLRTELMGDKKLTGPSTSQSLGPVSARGEPCVRMLPENAPHFPDSTTEDYMRCYAGPIRVRSGAAGSIIGLPLTK